MAEADGSIVFKAEIDDKQAQSELNRLAKKIDDLKAKMSDKKAQRSALASEAEELAYRLDTAKAKLQELLNTNGEKSAIREAREEVSTLSAAFNKAQGSAERLDASIAKDERELGRAANRAGELSQQLAGANSISGKMSDAAVEAGKRYGKLSKRIASLVKSALIFTVITKGLIKVREYFSSVIKSNDETAAAIARLKGALLTLAQPIFNVIIPAFTKLIDILTKVVATIASFISALFGSSIEASSSAAESLNKEQQALQGVGGAAKKASKDLASFDEINKLSGENVSGGGGSSSSIAPDFSFAKDGLLSSLKISLSDVFFEWGDDLSSENIISKVIVGLGAICGGIIGFAVGGVGGAVIGMTIGAALGLIVSNMTMDGDGEMSSEEVIKIAVLALGAIAGGVLGFIAGGPTGAAIGVLAGAGITLQINKLLFNNDGVLSEEEIAKTIIVALMALAGGVIGFAAGGPLGALIGATAGAVFTLDITKTLFDGDGQIDKAELIKLLVLALGFLAGGIIGFVAGGPLGAVIGATVGTAVSLSIVDIVWSKDGKGGVKALKILTTLADILNVIGNFVAFGVTGGLLSAIIQTNLSLKIRKLIFKSDDSDDPGYEEGQEIGDNVKAGAQDSLGVHSPSTEFQEMGGYLMQGMENGIKNDQDRVTKAFKTVLQGMKDDFKTWLSDFETDFGNFKTKFSENWSNFWKDEKTVFSNNMKEASFDDFETNFNTGFDNFKTSFSTGWKNFWSSIHYDFVVQWNGVLGSLQTGINNAVSALNDLVSTSNSLTPSNVFYGPVSTINVPLIQLPRLAQGAVIPPNREFMAVLGDQKSGTNIETPLATMVQAFRQALAEGGYGGSSEAVLMLDREQLGKVVWRLNKAEGNRIGLNLAGV